MNNEIKQFGVTAVEQIVTEGIGDVAMRSVAAKRPTIFGVDTYVLGNIVGGIVVGLAVPKVAKLSGEAAAGAELIGAGMLAKGLVQLAKQLTAPAGVPQGVVRAVPSTPSMQGGQPMAPSIF